MLASAKAVVCNWPWQLRQTKPASEGETHACERTKVMKDELAFKSYYGLNTKHTMGSKSLRLHWTFGIRMDLNLGGLQVIQIKNNISDSGFYLGD